MKIVTRLKFSKSMPNSQIKVTGSNHAGIHRNQLSKQLRFLKFISNGCYILYGNSVTPLPKSNSKIKK